MRTEFEYQLTEADSMAALRFSSRRMMRETRNIVHDILIILLIMAAWAGFCLAVVTYYHHVSLYFFIGLLLLTWLGLLPVYVRTRRVFSHIARNAETMKGTRRLCIEDEGLRLATDGGESLILWRTLHAIHELETQLLVYLDPISYFQVARTAFSGPEEQAEFLDLLKSRSSGLEHAKTEDAERAALAATTSAPETRLLASPWRIFVRNVEAGTRLAFFMRVDANTMHFSWGQLLALIALNLGLAFALEVFYLGIDGSFYGDALPGYLFIAPTILGAWLLACMGRRKNTSLMLIALIALNPIMVLCSGANLYFYQYIQKAGYNYWLLWGVYYGVLGWYTLAAGVAAVRLLQIPPSRYLFVFVAAALTLLLPWIYIDRNEWLWVPNQAPSEKAGDYMKEYYALTSEDAFYAQPALLEQALSTLKPGTAGQTELFFVGMAGYASQDVFMKEVNSVTELFQQRFGTAGHSVRLINNAESVADVPVASATALRASLKKIATLMNPDEDILFLFMTSHGSRDHVFSLRFGPMKFNDINPGVLRAILDDSGIKRRVVVISACYSGGFVDALKDDNTLVISAASPDKNSFGCSDDNDFTYFGKAYFDEALRETFSFAQAFEIALPRIEKREREENFEPSGPRIAVGKDIAPVLDLFAREREAALKKDVP